MFDQQDAIPSTQDVLSKQLQQRGFIIKPYYLRKSSFQLGYQLTINGFQLVYRLEGNTVIFIIYRRMSARNNLKNPFLVFDAFLYLLSSIPEVHEVKGSADALQACFTNPLSTEKLKVIYKQWFNGQTSHWEHGQEWLALQLSDYRPYFPLKKLQSIIHQHLQTNH
ncbi:hypothetical protein H0A36_09885 [Endozoicomonas sp. SM1973]|uniref:Uncharacterized protein n=1 Tax=Spartinivicinus marinus TaxID=2994442 RepID=A0A853HX48_9GAMM|nr:hypothetical protein [Spartinivicinus marinus]MCX4024653.1 hypothetical protein [Spartinivicinus marinus]NYZ66320.1 hypothetical protein [Spartinivicinus marinus]